MIKNLVFKGGGVRGIGYAGALTVLEEKGVLHNLERTAGTSAGAITALLVALRYSAAEIRQIVGGLDFASLQHGLNLLRLYERFGVYSNQHLMDWVEKVTSDKLGPNATFAVMEAKGYMDFHCVATAINVQKAQGFNAKETPSIRIAEAVVASMSIPGFFPKMRFPGLPYEYVDGGVVWNYPITIFDKDDEPDQTLGLYLHNYDAPAPLRSDGLIHAALAVFQSALAAQDVDDYADPALLARTIMINTLGISSADFGITNQQKEDLIAAGISAANNFLIQKNIPL